MGCILTFFAGLSTGWVNAATVVGAVAGIALSVFAIWFSKRLADESSKISEAIRANTEVTQQHTQAIYKHAKILRLDNLRNLYELSRGGEAHSYWHFRWRFETYDFLGVSVSEKDGENVTLLGHFDLFIQGFSVAADHTGFERRESEFYVAKIQTPQAVEGEQFPFAENESVACFDQEGHLIISKGVDPWTLERKYSMTIVRLGPLGHGYGPRTVETMNVFPRIKDA